MVLTIDEVLDRFEEYLINERKDLSFKSIFEILKELREYLKKENIELKL